MTDQPSEPVVSERTVVPVTFELWTGSALRPLTVQGRWDGQQVQPITVVGLERT